MEIPQNVAVVIVRFFVPSNAKAGTTIGRFRLTGDNNRISAVRVVDYFGGAPIGEVEDLPVEIKQGKPQIAYDYGDAPESLAGSPTGFPTLSVSNGARHVLTNGFYLGTSIDSEPDGQPHPQSLGDDGNGDDENGIRFLGPLIPGTTVVVEVRVTMPPGLSALLNAWIDLDRDLKWDSAGEHIFDDQLVVNGVQTFNVAIPVGLQPGGRFSRWRLSQIGNLSYKGDGGFGEVEDHRFQIKSAVDVACDLSCQGKDFWFAFPGNYSFAIEPVSLDLCIVGASGVTGNIQRLNGPAARITTPFTIPASGVFRLSISNVSDLAELNDAMAPKGVHVTANGAVSVFAMSHVLQSADGYLALPSDVLGTEYVIGSYGNVHGGVPELNGTQFAIVATQTNTTVTITPSVFTGLRLPGVPYSIVLTNLGDCYQLRNTSDSPADLTGTQVVSDKPVGVFGSHRIANVNSADPFFADYLLEQLLPVNRWGMEHIATPLMTRTGGDVIRVIAAQPETEVTIGTVTETIANPGEFIETTTTLATLITANKPVQVLQYATSSDFDGVTNSDPFMVTVPSRAHWSDGHSFCTPATEFTSHYLNVVAPVTATNSVLLGTTAVVGWVVLPGTDYAFATVTLGTGSNYTLTASDNIGAIVYGWGPYVSYAYPACLFFGDTIPPLASIERKSIMAQTESGQCTVAAPDLRGEVVASDNCGGQNSVTQTPPAGTLVRPGVHDIELKVSDSRGNSTTLHVGFVVTSSANPPAEQDYMPSKLVVGCQGNGPVAVNWQAYTEVGCLQMPASSFPPSGTRFAPNTTNRVVVTFPPTASRPTARVQSFDVEINCSRQREVKIRPPKVDPEFPSNPREITVEWDETDDVVLEVADQIEGPWTAIPGVKAKFVIKIANERGKFYRLREP